MSDVHSDDLQRTPGGHEGDTPTNVIPNLLPPERHEEMENRASELSAYTLASDQSFLSRDVDLWLRGPSQSAAVQGCRTISTNVPSLHSNGIWYTLALILPLFSVNNYTHWRCSPSTIINTAELLASHVGRVCDRVRCNIRRLAQNQMSRELLATAMDTILFVYAIGFIILSMYQASIIS